MASDYTYGLQLSRIGFLSQAIQREMSQIELQYDEMEEIGREVEQNLRDAEGSQHTGWRIPSLHHYLCLFLAFSSYPGRPLHENMALLGLRAEFTCQTNSRTQLAVRAYLMYVVCRRNERFGQSDIFHVMISKATV